MSKGYKSTHNGGLSFLLKYFTCECGNKEDDYFDKGDEPVMKCPECNRDMEGTDWPNNLAPTIGVK
ncbi:MAG: hypothetical protein ACYTBJ_26370 [Planctomycetota bacterium]|jgi:hypothetical protein